jgi:hypothetical protein
LFTTFLNSSVTTLDAGFGYVFTDSNSTMFVTEDTFPLIGIRNPDP